MIVGLGNPGREYAGTRHNVGFDVIAELAARFQASPPRRRHDADLTEIVIGSEKIWLIAPQTYMNRSGHSVRQAADFFQIPPDSILIVLDDMSLPVGKLRVRAGGSAGGQKGLISVLQSLGTQAVPRLRLGIGACPPQQDAADYVLGKFSKSERELVESAVYRAADACEAWVKSGLAETMNKYNADPAS